VELHNEEHVYIASATATYMLGCGGKIG